MQQFTRRTWLGATIGVVAIIAALGLSLAPDADARTRKGKRTKQAKKAGGVASFTGLFSCETDFEKRPEGARLLQKDGLNSGAWIVPGIDPSKMPRITIWACKQEFIEPHNQLRPYWRNKQKPPLPAPVKFDVCEPIKVSKIAKDRAWFSCSSSELLRVRVD